MGGSLHEKLRQSENMGELSLGQGCLGSHMYLLQGTQTFEGLASTVTWTSRGHSLYSWKSSFIYLQLASSPDAMFSRGRFLKTGSTLLFDLSF